MKFLSVRKKKNLSVEIHPRAYDAYHFFHSQSFLFDKTNIGIGALDTLQYGQFFSIIHQSEKMAYLFSGFEILGFSINQFDIKKHMIIVYEDLSDTEIEIIAWTGVLRILLSSVKESQLETFRKSFNESVPKSITKKLFSAKKLTQSQLAKCTPLSVSGLKKQKITDNTDRSEFKQNTTQSDIFENLINEAKRK